ncbi:MAG: hypothetical protein ACLTAI_01505 [Thomasclavelia sp.]
MVLLIITRDLVISNLITTVVIIIIFIFQNKPFIKYYIKEKINYNFKKLKELFILYFLYSKWFYFSVIVNIPKYAIDRCLNQSIQTYYGILMMPVLVINMLSVVVHRSMINSLSVAYNNNDNKTFISIIAKQILLIVVLTIIAIFSGYIIGLKLLELYIV